jgi:hypothetical protein
MIQYPWVGGGLGWFYSLYHKNINKTLISQNFIDDFWQELQIGDKSYKNRRNTIVLTSAQIAILTKTAMCYTFIPYESLKSLILR